MALPKEPRQKMINIMYLVLTAILALNVSSEILNAFQTIDDSFGKSNLALSIRSQRLINDFDAEQNKQFADKIAIWKPRAEKVKELSDEIFKYIENVKTDLKKESGLKAPDTTFKKDDLEATTRFLVEGKDKNKIAKGEELYNLLTKYKSDLAKIDPSIANKIGTIPVDLSIPKLYNKDDEKTVKSLSIPRQWATIYFHMTPTIAALAMLSKFQNDIRNSQTQLIEYCYSQVNSVTLPITDFGVIANANASMVMANEEVEITAGLGGYNSDSKPIISIDGANVPIGPDGKAIYKMIASGQGEVVKRVSITYTNPNTGKQETKTSDVKFKVGTPTGLAVSTDKTRVFYVNVPGGNPIQISGAVGGSNSIDVQVIGGNASASRTSTPGLWNVVARSIGEVTLKVTDGKNTTIVKAPAKIVPSPLPVLGNGMNSGSLSVGELLNASGVFAKVDPNFTFTDIKFPIESYSVLFDDGDVISSGGYFNGSVKNKFNSLQPGDRVIIYDIYCTAPEGRRKLEGSISLIIL